MSLRNLISFLIPAFIVVAGMVNCSRKSSFDRKYLEAINNLGLKAEVITAENFFKGIAPVGFKQLTGAAYKPSFNEDPGIPAQCWIETGYGTQNACKYCHTDYLSEIGHGNAFPIAEDQIIYSFPSANLNRILWQNIIYPQNIEDRLLAEGISLPDADDLDYIRQDNWLPTYQKARGNGNKLWLNHDNSHGPFALFPALNPQHLFPYKGNPTDNGLHGYIDMEGFVRDEHEAFTGWRAINFFPYAIFTPLSGSVSGIYIRLAEVFSTLNGKFDASIYAENLNILEKNIKNKFHEGLKYVGDAACIEVKKGFYPVGTEFAHPLHYVDLNADGEHGKRLDGVQNTHMYDYEFPGTRSKRVKEIRYMYKWKEVGLDDIKLADGVDGYEVFYGREGQGWIDNGAGWIIAGFIENRRGDLRPQTTEELAQCLGCHAKVGNTIDAVWSFQRKLPGQLGWSDMNYGHYNSAKPDKTMLHDYLNVAAGRGELGYFYHSVIGADLYGIMPDEIRTELIRFSVETDAKDFLALQFEPEEILNDEILKQMNQGDRKSRLLERQKLMRFYSTQKAYLYSCTEGDGFYLKGNVFYPSETTMKSNVFGYRKIVLDQSFNLGKDVFGTHNDHVPFTFRSDGYVMDEKNNLIPAGEVIYSRPYNKAGVGITPTGIISGDALDRYGNVVDPESPDAVGQTGTLDMLYNPIPGEETVKK